MAYIKSKEEIKYLIKGGKILGEILDALIKMAVPGVSTFDIDEKAQKMIKESGGMPSFKGYKGSKNSEPFPSAICASIDEEVVHGIPKKEKVLKNGDVFGIDIGMQWPSNKGLGLNGNGFFTDTAATVCIGKSPKNSKKLVNTAYEALYLAISVCKSGNTVADIGREVENYVSKFGYGIVRDLVGHGVGNNVHEEPHIPNYYNKDLEKWVLSPGVVLALEPMITLGTYEVETAEDGWGIITKDRSISAHMEHTVVITEKDPIIATKRPSE
jgi:methionyl aminopeptidase